MIETEIVNKEKQSSELLDFCSNAGLLTSDEAHVNMFHKNWHDRPETLPYVLYLSKRFAGDNGEFFILRINGKIEGISGVQISSFDKNVALGGVRSFISPEHRAKMLIGHHLLPMQLAWAKSRNLKTLALSFNHYNKRLMNYFKRSGMGVPKKRNPDRMFYNGVNEVPFSVNIQHTQQWVLYHKIDETYTPDWEKIAWESTDDKY